MIDTHAVFLIRQCPLQKSFDVPVLKLPQLKDNRAGNQRLIHLKIRIFRCRPNQNQRAVLHMRQKGILLAFVEPVNLVNKQNRLFAVHPKLRLGILHCFLDFLYACRCRVNLAEFAFRGVGNDFRQSGLACPRRAIKNNRAEPVALNGSVKQLALPDNMLLPDKILQAAWAHPCRKRCLPAALQAAVIFK